MKKIIFLSLILMAVVAFVASAQVSFVTGVDLNKWNPDFQIFATGGQGYNSTTVFRFMDYICGVIDANYDLGGKDGPAWFKLPGNVTVLNVAIIVSAYLDAHPDKATATGAYIVTEALRLTWPK